MDTPPSHITGLTQGVEKEPPVIVIMEDVLTPIPSCHDVIKSPCCLNANATCRAEYSGHPIVLSGNCTLTQYPRQDWTAAALALPLAGVGKAGRRAGTQTPNDEVKIS